MSEGNEKSGNEQRCVCGQVLPAPLVQALKLHPGEPFACPFPGCPLQLRYVPPDIRTELAR
jgi:hypothetical protein